MVIHKRVGGKGFTIVELLIVVVIIAILAAITLVTYNGIQQRANNAAIIDAASKSLRMIQAYIAANDKYPATNQSCITTVSGCIDNNGNSNSASSTFVSNMASIGTMPVSVPFSGTVGSGIWYTYGSTTTYNGSPQPARLTYFLSGVNQNCGVSNVLQFAYPAYVPSSSGYTYNYASIDRTLCWVSIPGPAA